jgi:WD40 repeat protein
MHLAPTLEGDLALRRALEFAATPMGGVAIAEWLFGLDINDAGTRLAVAEDDGVHILDTHTLEEVTTLHRSAVEQVAFAASGKRLIVIARPALDSQVLLYALDSWRLLGELGSPATNCYIAVSADGRYVAVAAQDQTWFSVHVYDAVRGKQLRTLHDSVFTSGIDVTGRGGVVNAVKFAPDGDRIAVAWRPHVSVFDLTSGGESVLEVPEVRELAFDRTGTLLACAGGEDVTVYDLERGTTISLGDPSPGSVTAVVFGTCRNWILAIARGGGSESGIVDLIDGSEGVPEGNLLHRIVLDRGGLSLAFGADDETIAVGAGDGWVRLFDVASGELLACYDHSGQVNAVRFIPDANVLASVGTDGKLWLFAPAAGAELAVVRPGGRAVTCAFTPDGAGLLVGGRYCGLSIWSLESGQRTRQLLEHMAVKDIALDRQGRIMVASVGADLSATRAVVVFGWPRANELRTLGFEIAVTRVALSPDGSLVAVGLEDQTIQIVEIGSAKLRQVIELDGKPWALAFSPDGQRLATGIHTGITQVFDVHGGTEVFRQEQHDLVRAVAFSPDGSRVAAAGWDGTVRVRDAASGTEQLRLGHNDCVSDVKFSPDGTLLVSGSHNGDVRIFDARSGVELSRIHHKVGKDEWLNAVAISPDGSTVASAGDDGAARLWPLGAALVDQAQKRIARPPTQAERRRYFAEAPSAPESPPEAGTLRHNSTADVQQTPATRLGHEVPRPGAGRLRRWARWTALTRGTRR